GIIFMDNKADTGVKGDIVDYPVDKRNHPVPESDQRHQVDEHPYPPRKESLEADFPNVYHRFVTADSGHGAFVKIIEFFGWLAVEHAHDVFREQLSLLLGNGSYPRVPPRRVLGDDGRYIADGEDILHAQYPAFFIGLYPVSARNNLRVNSFWYFAFNACRPQYCPCFDVFSACEMDLFTVICGYLLIQQHPHAQFPEVKFRFFRCLRR